MFCYSKRSQLKNKHVYVNDDVSVTTSLPSTGVDNQYVEVIPDTSSPYAEIGLSDLGDARPAPKQQKKEIKRPKLNLGKKSSQLPETSSNCSPIRYIEAPSGELYAVSSKVKATEAQGAQKPKLMYRKGPRGDLYAVPNKEH